MHDGAYRYLIDQLRQIPGRALWFAEESCSDYLAELAPFNKKLLLLSARVDIVNAAKAIKYSLPNKRCPMAKCRFRKGFYPLFYPHRERKTLGAPGD